MRREDVVYHCTWSFIKRHARYILVHSMERRLHLPQAALTGAQKARCIPTGALPFLIRYADSLPSSELLRFASLP